MREQQRYRCVAVGTGGWQPKVTVLQALTVAAQRGGRHMRRDQARQDRGHGLNPARAPVTATRNSTVAIYS